MARNIVEVTKTTFSDLGTGLNTKLFFDVPLMLDRRKPIFYIEIDTCVVAGNKQYPYQITAHGIVNEIYSDCLQEQRCSIKKVVDTHWKIAQKYKKLALKGSGRDSIR